jgi:hypothetical protein
MIDGPPKGKSEKTGKTPSAPPTAPAGRPDDLSWDEWEDHTQQREAPSEELLEAMKQPDMPPVVLQAIARRSSKPSVPVLPSAAPDFDEDTERYHLPKGAPIAARMAAQGVTMREEPEQSIGPVVLLSVLFIAATLAWLSFGLIQFIPR